jgi:SpoIID/LytB domain protein
MSLYGADAMAESGADYTQILSHYYPGTERMTLEE